MAQVQKERVRTTILESALRLFAARGFVNTSMGDIAAEAGISVGNVYRYYAGKQHILEAALPEGFVSELRERLSKKITTGKSSSLRAQSANPAYLMGSEDFRRFILSNKTRLLVLFGHPEGTPYESFEEEFVRYWVRSVLAHFVPRAARRKELSATLTLLFHGYLQLYMTVLSNGDDEPSMNVVMERINRYHLSGLASLLEEAPHHPQGTKP